MSQHTRHVPAGQSPEPGQSVQDAPADDADAGLEANLRQVTDREWLEGHLNLIATGALPPGETRYLFDPDRDPVEVAAEDLTVDGRPRG